MLVLFHFEVFVEIFEVITQPSPYDHILGLSISTRARHSLCFVYFGLTSWSVAKNVVYIHSLRRTYSGVQWDKLSLLEGKDDAKHNSY